MKTSNSTVRGVEARREYIVSQIGLTGELDVSAAAEALQVSPMTVRRDLKRLDAEGLIRRIHGGATHRALPTLRSATLVEEKTAIARKVADLVGADETIGLDVGSTCTAVAEILADRSDIEVISNSIHAAMRFQTSASSLILLGGKINAEGATIGNGALGDRSHIYLDKLILGCGGLSASAGVTYHDWDENIVRRNLLGRATHIILATDHTKFQHIRPHHLCDLEMVDVLVTDQIPPSPLHERLTESGVQIVLA